MLRSGYQLLCLGTWPWLFPFGFLALVQARASRVGLLAWLLVPFLACFSWAGSDSCIALIPCHLISFTCLFACAQFHFSFTASRKQLVGTDDEEGPSMDLFAGAQFYYQNAACGSKKEFENNQAMLQQYGSLQQHGSERCRACSSDSKSFMRADWDPECREMAR